MLCEYPVLRLLASGQEKQVDAGGFVDALPLPADAPDVWAKVAKESGEENIVVIDSHVTPSPALEAYCPEPILSASSLCLLFPARSVVTGLVVSRGVRLVPSNRFDGIETLFSPSLTLPHVAGSFAANYTPQRAFRTAYLLTADRPVPTNPLARHRFALSASLGSEALNGPWWMLGALYALLDQNPVEVAWAKCAPLLADPSGLSRRSRELARKVRLATDLPVQAMDQRQSRAVKALIPNIAPADYWQGFVEGCADLGADGKTLAVRYALAGAAVWPGEISA